MVKQYSRFHLLLTTAICILVILQSFLSTPTPSLAQQTMSATVSATGNLFRAAETATPPDGTFPNGAGDLPVQIDIAGFPAGDKLTFPGVSGTVTCDGGPKNGGSVRGADGSDALTTNLSPYQGISGIIYDGMGCFLTGVFLGAGGATGTPPASLHFSAAGGTNISLPSFTTLRPQLGQLFFIGDGLTGTGAGSLQEFVIPNGATQLYLGFADGLSAAPGGYDDNGGALTVSIDHPQPTATPVPTDTQTPEPRPGYVNPCTLITHSPLRSGDQVNCVRYGEAGSNANILRGTSGQELAAHLNQARGWAAYTDWANQIHFGWGHDTVDSAGNCHPTDISIPPATITMTVPDWSVDDQAIAPPELVRNWDTYLSLLITTHESQHVQHALDAINLVVSTMNNPGVPCAEVEGKVKGIIADAVRKDKQYDIDEQHGINQGVKASILQPWNKTTASLVPPTLASISYSNGQVDLIVDYPFSPGMTLSVERAVDRSHVATAGVGMLRSPSQYIVTGLGNDVVLPPIDMVYTQQYDYIDPIRWDVYAGQRLCYRARYYVGIDVSDLSAEELCVDIPPASGLGYGILSVSTIPADIQPLQNLPGLFDGDAIEGDFALIDYTPEPVSVIITFPQKVTLSGFNSTVGGYHGAPDENFWTIAADDNNTGSFHNLVSDVPTDGGPVSIQFDPYTAQTWKITSTRNNGDGKVHMSEITPVLAAPDGGATISGTLYDGTADHYVPLGGGYVQVCQVGGYCTSVVTGSDGGYSVSHLGDGQYSISALPPAGSNLLLDKTLSATVSNAGDLSGQDVVLRGPALPPAGTSITSVGTTPDGLPVVYWADQLTLTTQGCSGGRASYSISQDNVIKRAGAMTEDPGTGTYTATLDPLNPVHGPARVSIDIYFCPNDTVTNTVFDMYIDPSGTVSSLDGTPLPGATVTIYRSDSALGPFSLVPDGSALLSPMNRHNPDTTGANGHFGWDVIAGYYKVRAAFEGCTSPDDANQPYVESPVLMIPPEVTNLGLQLDCSGLAPTQTSSPTVTLTATEPDTGTPTLTATPATTLTPTRTRKPSRTPRATRTATATATQTPTATVSPTRRPYPATIAGLQALLKDLKGQGQVDDQLYRPLNELLRVADQLLQAHHKEAALVVLRIFVDVSTAPNNHHLTPAAAQQLAALGRQVIANLR